MQSILLQKIHIISSKSQWHLKTADISIKNGFIDSIAENISSEGFDSVKNCQGLSVSEGWIDLFSVLQDPGYEFKDTKEHLAKSAAFGGFTRLAVMPNTLPITQSNASVAQIKSLQFDVPVEFLPIAAATNEVEGKEMTELYDLHRAGAVAFSDGTQSLNHVGLLQRILLYLQPFDGVFINKADLKDLTEGAQMHEDHMSTSLGMPGFPSIAEKIAITNDLSIVEYTEGKMHFSHISTADGVALIREAKAKGLKVTADVAAHQLYFTDESLTSFETNFKVKPPFRTQKDIEALWEGIADDTIDAIVSSHHPQDQESKELEYNLADFGILGLETAFGAIHHTKPKNISSEKIIEKLTKGPSTLLKLADYAIQKGAKANLTIFDTSATWVLEKKHIQSKSSNTPFIGKELTGKVIGTISQNKTHWNSH